MELKRHVFLELSRSKDLYVSMKRSSTVRYSDTNIHMSRRQLIGMSYVPHLPIQTGGTHHAVRLSQLSLSVASQPVLYYSRPCCSIWMHRMSDISIFAECARVGTRGSTVNCSAKWRVPMQWMLSACGGSPS
jgi:hypothetical protein